MVMDEMKLISLVRERRCLWCPTEANYKDINQKKVMWEDIGRRLNVSALAAKNRWRNLRDSFIKRCSAMNQPYGSDYRPVKWKYYKQMLFLRDVMESRRSQVNFQGGIIKTEHVTILPEIENDTEEPTLIENDTPTVSRKRSKNVWHSKPSTDPLASLLDLELREKDEPWREQEMRFMETRKSTNYYFLNSLVDPMDALPLEVQLSIKEQYTSIMHAALRANTQTTHSRNLR